VASAKQILAEALERVLREHNIKIETVHAAWDGPIQGNIPSHRYKVRGLEIQAHLKEMEKE
jgi:hypothetical protein